LAQLFTRFGVQVMVLEGGPYVAMTEEPEIGAALVRYLESEKVRICTNVMINRVERQDNEFLVYAQIDGTPEV
jgi:pyruvate/2-oxoglutarate dehydrogenase complex dihydrolipoamide dehydrogenase (E3) component